MDCPHCQMKISVNDFFELPDEFLLNEKSQAQLVQVAPTVIYEFKVEEFYGRVNEDTGERSIATRPFLSQ